ncbi:hypothetical protein MVEN_01709100 [Mycena venus]|uniref:Phospholipase D/nuclease n=1 Tax=Mycena venus TaxID=2733690 RepID=A0A8H7CQ64_9AGAR|nr:hypothetical protein MVEN_01709100 [Mycena venus]
MNSDDDADLARAIALSMQEAERAKGRAHTHTSTSVVGSPARTKKKTKPAAEQEVLVISSDEDEDEIVEIARPVTKRKQANGSGTNEAQDVARPAPPPAPAPAPRPTPATGAGAGAGPLSLLSDRAQMERERLARQKRVRGPSPPPAPPSPSSHSDDDDDDDDAGSGERGQRAEACEAQFGGKGRRDEGTFPDGALLRIDTQHADPAIADKPACIRLSELLGPKDELAFVILSAFVVDLAWIYGFFERETPVVLVTDGNTCGAGTDSVPTLKNIFPNWIRVCPPLPAANGYGCMHMKFMLLFGKSGGLRVVVSSANLVPHDWRDVENYLFVQDIPPATPGTPTTRPRPLEKQGESFPAMVARALRSVGVEEALAIMARQGHTSLPLPTLLPSALTATRSKHGPTPGPLETRWDWRGAKAALVPSVAGRWEGWAGEGAVICRGGLAATSPVRSSLLVPCTSPVVLSSLLSSFSLADFLAPYRTGQTRLLRAVQALGCSLEDGVVAGGSGKSKKAKGKAKAKVKTGGKWEIELDCLVRFPCCLALVFVVADDSMHSPFFLIVCDLPLVFLRLGTDTDIDVRAMDNAPQTSSIGTYTPPWLAVFRLCAAGRARELQAWLDRGRKKTPPQGPTRVLFPTLETVRGTVLGEGGAGTVFCRRGQWAKIAALVADSRLEMRDARSRSGPMILGTLRGPPEPETDPEATESSSDSEDASSDIQIVEPEAERRPRAWLYVGSHNFTPSAWGTLSGSGFSPVLNVRAFVVMVGIVVDAEPAQVTNYELGVVLRLETPEDVEAAVAWERPARKYGRGDLPWIQEDSPFFQ